MRVKKTVDQRFDSFIIKTSDCWLWGGYKDRKGYGRFDLYTSRLTPRKNVFAHRYSYARENAGPLDNMCVCHKCDNPSCVRPDHLFLGTHSDNMKDMAAKGRHHHGDAHNFAKLSALKVVGMRELHELGVGMNDLAVLFNVDRRTASRVVKRQTWSHV